MSKFLKFIIFIHLSVIYSLDRIILFNFLWFTIK